MTFNFEHEGDAFLSVCAIVIGADQVGSLAERDFLFQEVMELPLFGSPSRDEFGELLARVTDDVYTKLPCEAGVVTPEGIDLLLADVRDALGPEQRELLMKTAGQLCGADGVDEAEVALMTRIREGLI
jgi:hypothetical protein